MKLFLKKFIESHIQKQQKLTTLQVDGSNKKNLKGTSNDNFKIGDAEMCSEVAFLILSFSL